MRRSAPTIVLYLKNHASRLRIIGDTYFRLPGVACVNDACKKAIELLS
jgi:hypothetical protein